MSRRRDSEMNAPTKRPWATLWAMLLGYFMTLIDWTAVAVANPSIMVALHTDYDSVIWVTSAYLLGFAVPLIVAGRLGDQFGPKTLYLSGLALFTAASLWCGLSGSIGELVAARVVQGLGAAMLTPQVLAMITRIFPPQGRGVATSVRGAAVGVATLAGPLVGGLLVDQLSWQWIFFVNVPIGIVAFAFGIWLIPVLPTARHRFDILGVAASGVGLFLIVLPLQEFRSHQGALWVWAMLVGGLAAIAAFVFWQSANDSEPLIPLRVFSDRNFSVSSVGVSLVAFSWTAMVLPVMFFAQTACGLPATRAALLMAPMAVATAGLAPLVGRIVDRSHPRGVIGVGFAVLTVSLVWLSIEMTVTTPIWRLLLPFTGAGVGMALLGAPLAATAIRNLAPEMAGAGAGVFTATRQVGSVLGSASMAAVMDWLVTRQLPPTVTGAIEGRAVLPSPESRDEFATAMAQAILLPATVSLIGMLTAFLLVGLPKPQPASAISSSEPVT